MEKNTKAIDKIIGEMSMQCYLSARRKTSGRLKSYSLSYLEYTFDVWLRKYGNTPEGLACEMKHFAEMEI